MDSFRRTYFYLCALLALYAALLLTYSQTLAFTFDESYHLLAAQLIGDGRTPYIDFCFPQTPLNAYWNAILLRIFGQTWRVPHFFAALLTVAALTVIVDYIYRRFPVPEWRFPAALTTLCACGLSAHVFTYGSLQAYGMCLLGLSLAFRTAPLAAEGTSPLPAALVGCFASVAAASSLLTFTASSVFLIWILYYNAAGSRWKKFAAFAFGAAIPFAPVWILFVRGFSQTWFNLFSYHVFFRRLYWPKTTQHDIEILTAWIDSGQALLLGLLAIFGLLFVLRRSNWPRPVRAEFVLCAWLAAVLAITVGRAHPTFARYFLLTTPFAAILAAAGLYAIVSRVLDAPRPLWPAWLVAFLFLFGLSRALYDRYGGDTWPQYERIAAKLNLLSPPGALIFGDEPIYFLMHRVPPPGYELSYTHKVVLPPAEAAQMHILTEAQVKAQMQSGIFDTAYSCDEEDVDTYGVKAMFRQHIAMEGCIVYWAPVKR